MSRSEHAHRTGMPSVASNSLASCSSSIMRRGFPSGVTRMRGRNRSAGSGPTAWFGLDGRVRLRGCCQGSIGRVAAGRHGFRSMSRRVQPRCRRRSRRPDAGGECNLKAGENLSLRRGCKRRTSRRRRQLAARARVVPHARLRLSGTLPPLSELDHDLLVQPDIHIGGAIKRPCSRSCASCLRAVKLLSISIASSNRQSTVPL